MILKMEPLGREALLEQAEQRAIKMAALMWPEHLKGKREETARMLTLRYFKDYTHPDPPEHCSVCQSRTGRRGMCPSCQELQ